MKHLPDIMVAPNGARRGRDDHPRLPVTIEQTVQDAKACYAVGAGALHAHVRDEAGQHVLDAGLYRELLEEMERQVPGMDVQITTEAVGRYTPDEQRKLVWQVAPAAVSVGLKEMLSDDDEAAARHFYNQAAERGITVQHILYSADDLLRLRQCIERDIVPNNPDMQMIFVLGRYTKDQQSEASALLPFLKLLTAYGDQPDWAVCAFGSGETACLRAAFEAGGKARVGFENSLWDENGNIAQCNADRVTAIRRIRDEVKPSTPV